MTLDRAMVKAAITAAILRYLDSQPCAICQDHSAGMLRVESRGDGEIRIEVRGCGDGQGTVAGNSWATDEVLDAICAELEAHA